MRGEVTEIYYENRRKNKQWVIVELRGKSGNRVGRCKFPSNWLTKVDP